MNRTSTLAPLSHAQRTLGRLAMIIAMVVPAFHAQAEVDPQITKGIWKLLYHATEAQVTDAAWLAADDDGDGATNQAELEAGTDPFSSNSVLRVGSLSTTATMVSMTFPTMAQKVYVVQATAALAPSNWANVSPAVQVTGDGTAKTLQVPRSAGAFFRVRVLDKDADDDGVADWAEVAAGLDPASAISNGRLDANGLPIADDAEAKALLAAQGTVSISAVESEAVQPSAPQSAAPATGKFKIVRQGFSKFLPTTTVNYGVGGTATPGVDYAALPANLIFSANETEREVVVTPIYNANRRNGGSAVMTLTASANYAVGGQGWAAVIINPTDAPSGTGLLGRYYDTAVATVAADAANFGQAGTYNFTRNASPTTAGSIVVSYTTNNLGALQVGHQVKLTFTSGNMNNALYNHLNYTVTAVTASTFTVGITAASALPSSSTGTCSLSVQSFLHPPVIERVDPTVNFDWAYGTPNGVTIQPNNSPDNFSAVWEGYLSPTTAGKYTFQLDADDKARVLLDQNDGNGLQQILEHGWDGPATVGTFKQSDQIDLVVPATPAKRYKIRVEHVETTGEARCRLQWKVDSGSYAYLPQANVYTHTVAPTYTFNRATTTSGTATLTLTNHGYANGNTVGITFAGSNLFTPTNYSGVFTVSNASANTFDIAITGTNLPVTVTSAQACFIEGRPESTTTGLLNRCYANTTFSGSPGRVGVESAVTSGNNGIWGAGSPDGALINQETFTARWTGQVQPQFSEDYTFIVQADDGCTLWINGQLQALKSAPSTSSGASYTYDGATGSMVVSYPNAFVVANSFVVGETVRLDPTSGNLNHGNNVAYTYDGDTGNTVVDYSTLTNVLPGGFVVGETVQLDPTTGSISPYSTTGYIVTAATATTFTVNFGTGIYPSGAGAITIVDARDLVVTAATATTFTVDYGRNKYATTSGNVNIEAVNKVLKDWSSMGNERFVRLPMVGGMRYDIQLDYYESTNYARCVFSWYSPSQPKQVIPTERLYPASLPLAGANLVSAADAEAVVGGAFSYAVAGSNGGTVSISGNPTWLTLSGGVLSGAPPAGAGGDYQILITTTNAAGTGTAVLNLHVDENTAKVTREFWNGVGGSGTSAIPVGTPPSGTANLTTLQAPTNFGDNYGTRIRGYITAPTTGNYYFWLAASDVAELWISNDNEPVNKIKRATVTAGSATALDWNAAKKSPWLALEAGRKYYFEVLHKAGTGTGDNLAIGWQRPGQTGTVPSEVVPGPVLSAYYDTPALANPGTLYVSTMLSQNGAVTKGVGTSTLRLSADETTATMTYSYHTLTGPITSQHIHVDPYLGNASTIVYDIDTPATPGDGRQLDGSYKWTITPVGTLSAADIREIIKQGKAYINLHTAMYPAGEIRGNYTLAVGSRTFTPPPTPPAWADDHTSDAGATRFLAQATYGANIADIAALKTMASYEAWIDDQFTKPATLQLPEVKNREFADASGGGQFDETLTFNAWWRNSMTGTDQLRQRVAYALSQIHVVSATGPLDNRGDALSYFYDRLASNALGNFRDILKDTTLTPTMGRYLDMLRNDKPDQSVGRIPNENYAREIKQLFSIGLYRLWPDGTLMLNSKDAPIDTYTQREIVGFAHVFTGWDYGYDGAMHTSLNATADWTRQMREVPARHFTGPKRILNNEVLPGLSTVGGQPLDPFAVHNTTHFSDPAYQALPAQELDAAHDQLFNHPNIGPFICRQLIQRLVSSNPSRDYLYRVVQKFNDNGSGVRGDMKAVVKAILLDFEARSSAEASKPAFGKQREPVLRVAAAARAFRQEAASGSYTQTDSHVMNITMPNKFAGGNNVYLEFPRAGAFAPGDTTPTTDSYVVLSTPAPTATTFSVIAKGWSGVSTSNGTTNAGVTGTYSQAAGSNVMTITLASHWLPAGGKAYLDFTTVTSGSAMPDDTYTAVTSTSTNDTTSGGSFTITVPDTTARAGFVRIPRFQGSYTVTDSLLPSPGNKRITLDTTSAGVASHHLVPGDHVYLNITGGNPQAPDGEYIVESVPDSNTFTVLTTNISNVGDNNIWIFPLVNQPVTRSGAVGAPPSTFLMNYTNTDFDQTPLNSPTVFNFFLPDFKFSGALASQGMTTPEFQLTAETTVIRQANFIYNGLFNPTSTTAISSFKSGTNALVLDFSAWMGNATDQGLGAGPQPTQPWTSNANVGTLIDKLNTLLLAGQFTAPARTIIQNFLIKPITNMTQANPCVVTSVAHGLSTGDSITFYGVSGGTFSGGGINGRALTVTALTADTFSVAVSCTAAPNAAAMSSAHFSCVAYDNATTSDTNKRDRIRAIVHFILTSPDFTIQR